MYMSMNLSPQSRKWAYMSLQKFPCALCNPLVLHPSGLSAPHSHSGSPLTTPGFPFPKHWPGNVLQTEIWKYFLEIYSFVSHFLGITDVQYHENYCFTYSVCFVAVVIIASDGSLNTVCYFSLSRRLCFYF